MLGIGLIQIVRLLRSVSVVFRPAAEKMNREISAIPDAVLINRIVPRNRGRRLWPGDIAFSDWSIRSGWSRGRGNLRSALTALPPPYKHSPCSKKRCPKNAFDDIP